MGSYTRDLTPPSVSWRAEIYVPTNHGHGGRAENQCTLKIIFFFIFISIPRMWSQLPVFYKVLTSNFTQTVYSKQAVWETEKLFFPINSKSTQTRNRISRIPSEDRSIKVISSCVRLWTRSRDNGSRGYHPRILSKWIRQSIPVVAKNL